MNRGGSDRSSERQHERVVVEVEAGEDISGDLLIRERCTGAGDLICES